MPRRKQLKSIAYGIASSFGSRNNDVDGYWALGLFYKVAIESGSSNFSLNLISCESIPDFKYSKRIASYYFSSLLKQMEAIGFVEVQVVDAIIDIEFNTNPTKKQIMHKSTWGEPFVCKVTLVDDNSKEWHAEYREWCGQHNPEREGRSTRRYAL